VLEFSWTCVDFFVALNNVSLLKHTLEAFKLDSALVALVDLLDYVLEDPQGGHGKILTYHLATPDNSVPAFSLEHAIMDVGPSDLNLLFAFALPSLRGKSDVEDLLHLGLSSDSDVASPAKLFLVVLVDVFD